MGDAVGDLVVGFEEEVLEEDLDFDDEDEDVDVDVVGDVGLWDARDDFVDACFVVVVVFFRGVDFVLGRSVS